MSNPYFQFRFTTKKSSREVYTFLLNPNNWWKGIYNERIEGASSQLEDEFEFRAGEGAHYSKQKLVTLTTDKKIIWQVIESHLSFLQNPKEWEATKICFDIEETDTSTNIIFTHEGLIPAFECYGGCNSAWTKYLHNLEVALH